MGTSGELSVAPLRTVSRGLATSMAKLKCTGCVRRKTADGGHTSQGSGHTAGPGLPLRSAGELRTLGGWTPAQARTPTRGLGRRELMPSGAQKGMALPLTDTPGLRAGSFTQEPWAWDRRHLGIAVHAERSTRGHGCHGAQCACFPASCASDSDSICSP